MFEKKTEGRPKIAIIDSNTLTMMGLRQLLQEVMPIMTIETFSCFAELYAQGTDCYFHFFVATNIVLEHRDFFIKNNHKTIVLTLQKEASLNGFNSLCINVPEDELIKNLLQLEQTGHPRGKNLPPLPKILSKQLLSDREIEVLSLIAQGYINKEIAERLNIGLTTVITHRKNIQDKLGMKSVSALTIYAVMHGFVDINKI